MEPKQQKALAIAQSIMSAALGIVEPFKEKIPDVGLLKKRAFPDRRMPHRVKRLRKREARDKRALQVAISAMRVGATMANLYRQMATPAANYPKGESGFVGQELELK